MIATYNNLLLIVIGLVFIGLGILEYLYPKKIYEIIEKIDQKHGLKYLTVFYSFTGILLFSYIRYTSTKWLLLILGFINIFIGIALAYIDSQSLFSSLKDKVIGNDHDNLYSVARFDAVFQIIIGILILISLNI